MLKLGVFGVLLFYLYQRLSSLPNGFEFSAPQRTTRESSERKRVTGRQSVSSNDEVYDSSERRGPPKRRAVRKTKNNDDKSTRRGPPVRKSPPQRKPDLDDSDEFSDFSF